MKNQDGGSRSAGNDLGHLVRFTQCSIPYRSSAYTITEPRLLGRELKEKSSGQAKKSVLRFSTDLQWLGLSTDLKTVNLYCCSTLLYKFVKNYRFRYLSCSASRPGMCVRTLKCTSFKLLHRLSPVSFLTILIVLWSKNQHKLKMRQMV